MAEKRFEQLLELIQNLDRRIKLLEQASMCTLELLDTVFMDDAKARHLASNPATRTTPPPDSNE